MIKTISYPYEVKQLAMPNNITMAYMDEGQGDRTFVFIHGLANYAPVWKHQFETLSKNNRCVAPDLPGNGLSPGGEYPYGVFFYAECVKIFCETLGLKNIILVGHSMGGQIAIMLGLRYSSQFEQIALIAPAGIEYFSSIDVMIMQQMLGFGEFLYSDEQHIRQAIHDSFFSASAEKHRIISDLTALLKQTDVRNWRKMAMACINSMLTEQVSGFLGELSLPVTLIFGNRDAMIPNRLLHPAQSINRLISHAEAMIPRIKSHLIKDAGHFVQIEKAHEVNKILLSV